MRKNTLYLSKDGYGYRVSEVPRWRSLFANSVEGFLATIGHPCCKWGWAHSLLSWALNVEFKAEKTIVDIPLTKDQAALLEPEFVRDTDD